MPVAVDHALVVSTAKAGNPSRWQAFRRMLSSLRRGDAKISDEIAKAAQATPARPSTETVGLSGSRISGGRIWDYEHNAKIGDKQWPFECERMLREDPQVASCYRAVVDTLASATWRYDVAPPSGNADIDAQAQRAADWSNEAFGLGGRVGRLKGGWEAAVRTILPFLFLGYRYLEEIYEVADGYVWLSRFADREPTAHSRWVTDDNGDLAFVEQTNPAGQAFTKFRDPLIPANKLVLFSLDRTGQNYEGRGLGRPCHFWAGLKRHAGDMLACGLERWAIPTPIVKSNIRLLMETGFTDEKIATLRAAADANAKQLVAHNLGYLSTVEGIDFGTYGDGAFNPSGAVEIIQMCDRQIAQAFLLGFLQLGVSDTGSRSVGEVQETFFGRAVQNVLDHIAAVVGGPAGPGTGTLGRLMAWNFPGLPASSYPRLKHDGLGEKPLVELAGALPGLASAGLLTPTDDLESDLRAALGAAPLADSARRTPAERAPAPSAGAMFAQALRDSRARTLGAPKD